MGANRNILIIGEWGRRLDIHNPALRGWTVHLAPDFETARRHLSGEGRIDVVAVPKDPGQKHTDFMAYCRRHYPRITSLLVLPENGNGNSEPGTLPTHADPERLAEALREAVDPGAPPDTELALSGAASPDGTLLEDSATQEIRFKEDWVRVVAHDIRSPLTLINSYATMLLRDGFGNEAQARLVLERIRNSGQWMMALVDNILDLALLEAGRLELKYAPSTLADMLSRACENMRTLAENAQVTLEWETPDSETSYPVDHLKIDQVLQNLIGNSLKHSERGSRVLVRATAEHGRLVFSVRDWGRGMTPDQIKRIFDRFSSTAASPSAGRGLGLTIANTLVRLHGGAIQVESTLGEGATFTFSIQPQPPSGETA